MPQTTPPLLSLAGLTSCSPPTQVSFGGAQEACPTGLYTHGGECCRACNLGEGVAQPCGANQTVCEPCLDSEYRRQVGRGRGQEWKDLQVLCLRAGSPAHNCMGIGHGSAAG